MTTEEIIKGNKLIAEFMGFVKYYPNMTSESDLSNFYYYLHLDKYLRIFIEYFSIVMCSRESRLHPSFPQTHNDIFLIYN